MAKMNITEVALPQETIEVDGEEYTLNAWPASFSLAFLEKNAEILEQEKPDYSLVKQVVIKSACKDNKLIDEKRFDILFSRKTAHLLNLYKEILNYNLGDLFTLPDSEE